MFTLQIIPLSSLAILRFTGKVEMEDVLTGIKAYLDHPDYQNKFKNVADFRNSDFNLTGEDAEAIAKFTLEQEKQPRLGCILVTKPIETALSIKYQKMVAKHHSINVFSTLVAASDFVGEDLSQYLPQSEWD